MSNISPDEAGHDAQASMEVIEALIECDGLDFESQDWILYDYIDPDALDAIFSRTNSVKVEFTIEETTVTVWQDEHIHVHVNSR